MLPRTIPQNDIADTDVAILEEEAKCLEYSTDRSLMTYIDTNIEERVTNSIFTEANTETFKWMQLMCS
jgi:hypothetical protein